MALNFRISVHRSDMNLHLKLVGDFDGTSEHMLLHILRKHCRDFTKIFIHTSRLKSVIPFGQNVFHKHLHFLKGEPVRLIFTGENACRLSP